MDKMEFAKKMLQCPLFTGLEPQEMLDLLGFAKFKVYKPGEVVVQENAMSDVFFIVETGRLDAFIASTSQQSGIHVKDIKAGDLIGEMAMLGIEKRTATIITKNESRLIIWNGVDCLDHFRKHRAPGYIVMKNLSEILGARVRDMNIMLRNSREDVDVTAIRYL